MCFCWANLPNTCSLRKGSETWEGSLHKGCEPDWYQWWWSVTIFGGDDYPDNMMTLVKWWNGVCTKVRAKIWGWWRAPECQWRGPTYLVVMIVQMFTYNDTGDGEDGESVSRRKLLHMMMVKITCVPVARSHTLTVISRLPDTNTLPCAELLFRIFYNFEDGSFINLKRGISVI